MSGGLLLEKESHYANLSRPVTFYTGQFDLEFTSAEIKHVYTTREKIQQLRTAVILTVDPGLILSTHI